MTKFSVRRLALVGTMLAPLFAAAPLTAPMPAWAQEQPAADAAADAATDAADNPVVAVVNGQEIRLAVVRDQYEAMKANQPQLAALPLAMVFDQLLDSVVSSHLVSQAGYKAGLAEDPEVQQRMEQIRDRLVGGAYLEDVVDQEVSENAVQARYDQMKAEFTPATEINARHILVNTKEEAEAAIEKLNGGADFAALAKELSVGPSGKNGGDLGYFTREQMVEPFAEAAFAMEPGTISDQPVKTEFGWHVIKVEDSRETQFPPLAEKEDEIRSVLAGEVVDGHVESLKDQATVTLFTIDGAPRDGADGAADGDTGTGTGADSNQ